MATHMPFAQLRLKNVSATPRKTSTPERRKFRGRTVALLYVEKNIGNFNKELEEIEEVEKIASKADGRQGIQYTTSGPVTAVSSRLFTLFHKGNVLFRGHEGSFFK